MVMVANICVGFLRLAQHGFFIFKTDSSLAKGMNVKGI